MNIKTMKKIIIGLIFLMVMPLVLAATDTTEVDLIVREGENNR